VLKVVYKTFGQWGLRPEHGRPRFSAPHTLHLSLTSNMTIPCTHRGPNRKHTFVCRYVAPPGEWYYNTLLCCH